jgi:hypothetical protein
VTARMSCSSVARVLGEAEALLGGARPCRRASPRLVLVAARRRQRRGAVGAGRLEGLEHVLLFDARPPRRSPTRSARGAGRSRAPTPCGRRAARAPGRSRGTRTDQVRSRK